MPYKNIAGVAPYHDDYDEDKNFLRILYNPGHAVQARELTQVASILQSQVAKFGNHIFKDGASVYDAKITVDTEKPCIEIESLDAGSNGINIIDTWKGQSLIGITSGAKATIDNYDASEKLLYINSISSEFEDGEEVSITGSVQPNNIIITASGSKLKATLAHVSKGVVYVNKHFVVCPSQTIIVEPKNVSSSHKIGYLVKESIVTPSEDVTLNDPANGAYNFNAPGADRYNIELELKSYEDSETLDDDFLSIVEIDNGGVVKGQNLVEYSVILDTLAHRTYDESGNYSIDPFNIKLTDHESDDTKLSVIVDSGKAYVLGYEVETVSPTIINIDRSRTTESKINAVSLTPYGPYTDVDYSTSTNVKGTFDINAKELVELMTDVDGNGDIIGSGRILSIQQGSTNELRLYISGMDKYESAFSSVRSIRSQATPANYMNIELYAEDGDLPRLYSKNSKSLIFNSEDDYISNIVNNQTTYNVTRNINVTSDGLGQATINAGASEIFPSNAYIYSTINSSGTWITGANILSGAGTNSIIIQNLPASTNIDISYIVTKSNANWKTKTLTQGVLTTDSDVNGEIILSHVDIYDIISNVEDPSGSVIDALNNTTLDNGQTDYFYDYGTVSNLTPSTEHTITYLYFSHGGIGDYFAVDSYLNTTNNTTINPIDGEPYNDFYGYIPNYSSTLGINHNLRDSFDFRRSINDLAAGTDLVIPNDTITTDYDYYVPRIDKVFVDPYGNFGTITGVPEKLADHPKEPSNAMVISTLYLSPYTSFPEEVKIELKDTRRYTMADIGELERRLENVEYYTAMNLLELNAKELRITDKNGFDKFKNGILVDKFTGHDVADVYHVDYRCAIDPYEETLRPAFLVDNIDFKYNASNSSNVAVHDNIVTKSYTTQNFIKQELCSETINVNPYNVFIWEGTVKLSPAIDNWVDTNKLPDLIVNENDSNANWANARRTAAAFGTSWGWWRTNWIGQSRRTLTSTKDETLSVWTGDWKRTTTQTTITNTRRGQTRFGTRIVVRPKTTRRDLGERVINTSIIPWIRTRNVVYTCNRMKPNTTVIAYFDGIDVSSQCNNLTTDNKGEMVGTFIIPNNKFRTGDRILRFADDITGDATTSAEGTYSASGLRQTKRRTIISITRPELVRQSVSQSRVTNSVTSSSRIVKQETFWSDPVAESFLINQDHGIFLSDIEVWFKTKPNATEIPITLRIVENDNGYPSQIIVPYSEVVLYPSSVNVSAVSPYDGAGEINVGSSTKFTFSDPVYLQDATEYSFMLISNSNEYEIYIGKIGENKIGSTSRIDKQPYAGVMFKSQNASTWTADQERDIMFRMNRCVFDTVTPSIYSMDTDISFANDKLVTTNMFNIENITPDTTDISLAYQYSGDSYMPFEDKEDVNLSTLKTIQGTGNSGNSDQLNVKATMTTTTDNVTPIVSVDSTSSVIVATELSDDTVISPNNGQSYKVGGRYITRSTNLSNPADDLKVLIDTKIPSTTDIAVYFKTGAYEPRYVPFLSGDGQSSFLGEQVYFYYDTTASNVVSRETSAIISQVDEVNDRYYLKSISDASKLVDPSGLTGKIIFVTDIDDITFLETWAAGTSYTVGQHVWEGSELYENLINDTGTLPSTDALIWKAIEHTHIENALVVGQEQEWREMIKENFESPDQEDYIETTYKPKEEIIDEFSSFSVKIELLTNDEVTFPTCKAFRSIALY